MYSYVPLRGSNKYKKKNKVLARLATSMLRCHSLTHPGFCCNSKMFKLCLKNLHVQRVLAGQPATTDKRHIDNHTEVFKQSSLNNNVGGANWHLHTALTCLSVLWGARSGTPGLQPESREPTRSQLRRFLRTYRRRSACVRTFPYMCQWPLCCKGWKCRSQRDMSTNCPTWNSWFASWFQWHLEDGKNLGPSWPKSWSSLRVLSSKMIVAGDPPPSRGSSYSQVVVRLGKREEVEMKETSKRRSSREEVERRFTSHTALDQTPWGGPATFTETHKDFFLFIESTSGLCLWFVPLPFLITSWSDIQMAQLRTYQSHASFKNKKMEIVLQNRNSWHHLCTCVHNSPICIGWWPGWEVINAVVTSHQNQLDHHKNVPQVSKLLGKGKRLERICSLQRLKLFFAWDVYHHCNMIALDSETD